MKRFELSAQTDVELPSTLEREGGTWPAGVCTLDHDGCVVCSDAGIPLRVVDFDGDDAVCEDAAGTRTVIAIELVQPVHSGDILLTHGGVAIGRGVLPEAGVMTVEAGNEVRQ